VEEEEEQVETLKEHQLGPYEEEEETKPSGVNPIPVYIFRHLQDRQSNNIRYGRGNAAVGFRAAANMWNQGA
jgi:hypothetical protein